MKRRWTKKEEKREKNNAGQKMREKQRSNGVRLQRKIVRMR